MPGSPMPRRPRCAADTGRRERRGSWFRFRLERCGSSWIIGKRPTLEARPAAVPRPRPVVTRWSLRETRRAPSGGFFPGFEELIDDPPGRAPDDVVAERVVMDAVQLLADAPGFGCGHSGWEKTGDEHHEGARDLVVR